MNVTYLNGLGEAGAPHDDYAYTGEPPSAPVAVPSPPALDFKNPWVIAGGLLLAYFLLKR